MLNAYFTELCTDIIENGKLYLHKDMPKVTEELFELYETTGNRLIYENIYFERRKFLLIYSMLAYLIKDSIYNVIEITLSQVLGKLEIILKEI